MKAKHDMQRNQIKDLSGRLEFISIPRKFEVIKESAITDSIDELNQKKIQSNITDKDTDVAKL